MVEWLTYYEATTRSMGWTDDQKFMALPGYLVGSARRWYNFINKYDSDQKPRNFTELRTRMVKDLCAADFRQYLSQQLHNARQKPGQSTANFIYEMQELCEKIDSNMPESTILMLIRERLLPQIQHDITFQNPRTLVALLDAAKTSERAMNVLQQPSISTPCNSSQLDLVGTLQKIHECIHAMQVKFDQLQNHQRCNFCGKNGHLENECRRKQRYHQSPNFMNTPQYTNYPFMNPPPNYPNFNPNQPSTSGYQPPKPNNERTVKQDCKS